jgi:hypothetical protein
VEEIAGIQLKRTYDLNAPKGVNGRNSDNSMILNRLDWEPSIRLRDGLERTYRWIESQMIGAAAGKSMNNLLVHSPVAGIVGSRLKRTGASQTIMDMHRGASTDKAMVMAGEHQAKKSAPSIPRPD